MNGVILETDHAGPSGPVAARIADAFKDLAVAEWLIPDDRDERRRVLAGQFEMLVGPALDGHGHVDAAVDLSGNLVGVAVWLDFNGGHFPSPSFYDERLAELCGERLPHFKALDEAFERHHPDPAERPHLHLAFCAVDPDRQTRGIGTRLLQQGVDRLDKLGAAGYLEAANEELTAWYAQYGFERRDPLQLPDGPQMYPMWRAKRLRRTADEHLRRAPPGARRRRSHAAAPPDPQSGHRGDPPTDCANPSPSRSRLQPSRTRSPGLR
ncbi:GNAT family N-acetyltransferase [Glycomyces paridis]|uniref:GNAT family N-acetyltransferase n=1 Tax=Glycomyces paridis TaxID=2126555 RepID=UPI0013053CCC|nr:GNAT family N-acetyltransferase [Glycomyces paridis]